LTGNYFRNGRPNQSLTRVPTSETLVAITLNIPIFDGFSKSYQIQDALALAEQKKVDLIEVERMVLTEFLRSYSDFETAIETNLSSESFLKSAQKSLDSMQRKLESGASDLTEVLIAQTALADARQQRIQALAELRSARLRLFANSATLGRTQSHTQ
jgi:outer membrane protein